MFRSRIAVIAATLAVSTVLALVTLSQFRTARAGGVFEVDRTDDVLAGASACTAAPMDCSLRGAIQKSNFSAGLDTIHVPGGTYTLTVTGAGEDMNATGDLDIHDVVSISGDGQNATTIQAGVNTASAIDRIFHIHADGGAGITDMTLRNGNAPGLDGDGGAILVEGHLEMSDVAVRASRANGLLGGGGIHQFGDGTVSLLEVTIADNQALNDGGGLFKRDGDGTIFITDSTVSGNTAKSGGGLTLGLSSASEILDTHIDGNHAVDSLLGNAGGIYAGADEIKITGGSVSNNTADHGAGGIESGNAITLNGTLISGNDGGDGNGGGFKGQGSLSNALITGNTAAHGGGLYVVGITEITDSAVTENHAVSGGGIEARGETLTVARSAITGNTASQTGGGLFDKAGTSAELMNVTLSGNSAISQGGAIYRPTFANARVAGAGGGPPVAPGPLSITNATIADNTADSGSAVFDAASGQVVNVKNTIIAGNTGGATCAGGVESLGFNIEDGTSCEFTAEGDHQNTDPLLDGLTNNGGPTDTHALLAGSPAINAGSLDCPPPDTDQRGVARPVNGRCDIGAFETDLPGPPTPTPTPEPTATPPSTETPAPTATPTPTPQPTGSPGPGKTVRWGDNQCDGDVDPVDALANLRYVASLSPVGQTEPCPNIGDSVDVTGASPHLWGDTGCDNDVDTVDALAILRVAAGLTPLLQTEPCPNIGDDVLVAES